MCRVTTKGRYIVILTDEIFIKDMNYILSSEENNNLNYISIYDILILCEKLRKQKKLLDNKIVNILNKCYGNSLDLYFVNSEYKDNTIYLNFQDNYKNNATIYFTKIDSIILMDSTGLDLYGDIDNYKEQINNIYNYYKYFNEIENINEKRINVDNTMLYADIGLDSVKLYYGLLYGHSNVNMIFYTNKLHLKKYFGRSNNVIKYLEKNEKSLLRKLCVKIDDCPIWMRDCLYSIKQDKINNQKLIDVKNKVLKKLTNKIS